MSSRQRTKIPKGRGKKTPIPARPVLISRGRGRGRGRGKVPRKTRTTRPIPSPNQRPAPQPWRKSSTAHKQTRRERAGSIVVVPPKPDKGKGPAFYPYRRSEEERKRGEDAVSSWAMPDLKASPAVELDDFEAMSLNISLFSFEEMEDLAVVKNINVPRGEGLGSVNDPRLGPYDPLAQCEECKEKDCPGHYGLIKFPEQYPVPSPIHLIYISRVLTCVCNDCSKLLQARETLEAKGFLLREGFSRLNAISTICQKVTCPRRAKPIPEEGVLEEIEEIETGPEKMCAANPEFYPGHSRTNGWIAYRKAGKDGDVHIMDPKKVYDILNKISDEDATFLGFNPPISHPRNMVLRGLLVIPTNARPPFVQGATVLCDQLTETYNKIVRFNESLKLKLKAPEKDEGGRCECYKELIASVRELMVANNAKKYQNRPQMALATRLQGKKGLFRRLLMGKRTDYCGRTVLGPDANLKFGQIRIPQRIAERLTIRVRVFEHNKRAVSEMVRRGRVLYLTYPKTGVTERYREGREYDIQVGMVVERMLQNGDRIMFNRQPTLHKYSLMSYEVVIGKQMTIGMHLAATVPHNADQLLRNSLQNKCTLF